MKKYEKGFKRNYIGYDNSGNGFLLYGYYHGFYGCYHVKNNKFFIKGFYENGMEHSHWINYNWGINNYIFNYYL